MPQPERNDREFLTLKTTPPLTMEVEHGSPKVKANDGLLAPLTYRTDLDVLSRQVAAPATRWSTLAGRSVMS